LLRQSKERNDGNVPASVFVWRLQGEAAPLSAASIARLKASWQGEYETWKRRRLDEVEPVYVWADGIYVKAGLEKDKGGDAGIGRGPARRAEGHPRG
jgi:hypothetical protein